MCAKITIIIRCVTGLLARTGAWIPRFGGTQ